MDVGEALYLTLFWGWEKPQGGEVLLGEHTVLPNYFEQNQVHQIHMIYTV